MKVLFPAQESSCRRLLSLVTERGAALDASETGTGKTVKSAHLARELGCPVVVVCPKIVVPAWRDEMEEAGIEPLFLGTYEKLRRGVPGIVTKSGKKTYKWAVPNGTLVIWDEVHKAKSTRSQNAAVMAAAKPYRNLLLSATPFDTPVEMRSIGYLLGFHRIENFYPWAMANGCVIDDYKQLVLKRNDDGTLHEDATRGLAKLAAQIGSVSSRVLMRELPMAFRENLIITDPIEFKDAEKIAKIYEECAVELEQIERMVAGDIERAMDRVSDWAEATGHNASTVEAVVNPLTELLRARQKAEILKVPDMVEMTEDLLGEGKSVVIFVNFLQTLESLATKLSPTPVAVIRGSQSEGERQAAIDAFQSDKVRVVICISSAGGVGVSLHDTHGNHPRVSLISPTFSAKEFKQVLGRIYRINLKTDVIQRVLVAKGTIEERVLFLMKDKLDNGDTLLDRVENTPTEEQPAHAEFGPSGLKSIKTCPGFENHGGSSAAAEMGTRCHLAMETGDDGPLENDYEVHLVSLCRQAEDAIRALHGMDRKGTEVFHEMRLDIKLLAGCDTFGTSDKIYIRGDLGVEIDYKFGKMLVDEPPSNWQAKAYALGTFQRFPGLNTLHFYFLQPQNDTVSHGVFTRDDCERLSAEITEVILQAKAARQCRSLGMTVPMSMVNPTPGTCDFCMHASTCTAVTNKAAAIATAYNGTDKEQATVHGSLIDDGSLLAEHLAWVPILESWAKGIRKRAIELLEQGGTIPGYSLHERSGGRKVSNPLMAAQIAEEMGVEEDAVMRLASIPWTALEDLISETAPRGQKKKRKEDFEAALFGRGGLEYLAPIQQLKRQKEDLTNE